VKRTAAAGIQSQAKWRRALSSSPAGSGARQRAAKGPSPSGPSRNRPPRRDSDPGHTGSRGGAWLRDARIRHQMTTTTSQALPLITRSAAVRVVRPPRWTVGSGWTSWWNAANLEPALSAAHSFSSSAALIGAAVVATRSWLCEREMSKASGVKDATLAAIWWKMTKKAMYRSSEAYLFRARRRKVDEQHSKAA
jgi:hypothetical protein